MRDREVWTNVSRTWYSKAADKRTTVGRLYHHIAILAKPNDLQQLFFYSKSLTVGQPFHSENFYFRLEEIWGSHPNAQMIAPLESSAVL